MIKLLQLLVKLARVSYRAIMWRIRRREASFWIPKAPPKAKPKSPRGPLFGYIDIDEPEPPNDISSPG